MTKEGKPVWEKTRKEIDDDLTKSYAEECAREDWSSNWLHRGMALNRDLDASWDRIHGAANARYAKRRKNADC